MSRKICQVTVHDRSLEPVTPSLVLARFAQLLCDAVVSLVWVQALRHVLVGRILSPRRWNRGRDHGVITNVSSGKSLFDVLGGKSLGEKSGFDVLAGEPLFYGCDEVFHSDR